MERDGMFGRLCFPTLLDARRRSFGEYGAGLSFLRTFLIEVRMVLENVNPYCICLYVRLFKF